MNSSLLSPNTTKRRRCLQALLAVVALTSIEAFQVNQPQHHSVRSQQTTVPLKDASEWYSPPPVKKEAAVPKIPAGQRALQTNISTAAELEAFLHNGDDRLVIVKFYASWCKSCALFSIKLDKLALQHADWVSKKDGTTVEKRGSVRIVNIEYGAARELCCALQVKKLPTVYMYTSAAGISAAGEGMARVQDFSCPPSQFQRLQDLTAAYLQQQKRRETVVAQQFEAKLAAGSNMIQEQLAAQLPAAAEQVYSAAAAVVVKEDCSFKQRLWNRLRNTKTE